MTALSTINPSDAVLSAIFLLLLSFDELELRLPPVSANRKKLDLNIVHIVSDFIDDSPSIQLDIVGRSVDGDDTW